jgi:hypothetical protein
LNRFWSIRLKPGIYGAFLFILAASGISLSQAAVFHIQAFAEDSAEAQIALSNFLPKISAALGVEFPDTVNVVIAASKESFDQAVGSEVPDWGAAVAIKEQNLIVVKSPRNFQVGKDIQELLGHELTHLVLNKAAGGKWLPRWFEEGFCQLMSGEWRFEQDMLLTRAVWGGGLIPLTYLESLNGFGGAKAALAYAESYLAVSMLARDLGMDFFPDFLSEYDTSGNFYLSFARTSGYKYLEWTNIWQDKTSQKYRFILFIFDSRLFFPLLAIIIILLYFVKMWQVRKKKKQWEKLERYRIDDETFPT